MARYNNSYYFWDWEYFSFPFHLCFFMFILFFVLTFSCGESFSLPLPEERDSVHRAGGSPWGVALLLVFLLFMVSYQSSFHGRWFPLATR
ncbi:oxidoreductase/transition metal ion-binding protein [Trifolium repens]|nr:oxidoreductase/transition metal ion-binding protein [Trifolium repens]